MIALRNRRRYTENDGIDQQIFKVAGEKTAWKRNHGKSGSHITAEMCLERNETLISTTDNTDYIVTSSMSALFLAQLSESPELISVFTEILSNEGNELFIKTAAEMNCAERMTAKRVRQILALQGCIFLGLLTEDEEGQNCEFNPDLNSELELNADSKLIVLCND